MGRLNCSRFRAYSEACWRVASAIPSCSAAVRSAPSARSFRLITPSPIFSPVGRESTRWSGVSGSRGVSIGVAFRSEVAIVRTPPASSTTRISLPSRCSTRIGSELARIRSRPVTTCVPASTPGRSDATSEDQTSGPGTSLLPSSANTRTPSAMPSPSPPLASGIRSEKTPSSAISDQRARSRGAWQSSSRVLSGRRPSQNSAIPARSAA